MSIQISGSSIPPDGTVTAAKISSGSATVGQVLTADGAEGSVWATVAAPANGSIEPRQLDSDFTRVTRALADNLDSFTTINFGQRKVLRYSLPNHRGVAVVTSDYLDGFSMRVVGGVIGNLNFISANPSPPNYSVHLTMIVVEDYTKTTRSVNHPLMETGGVEGGQIYADGSGLLFGWYTGDSGPFVATPGRGRIESAWLTENTLNIAINSAATSGGPFTLQGNLWIVY